MQKDIEDQSNRRKCLICWYSWQLSLIALLYYLWTQIEHRFTREELRLSKDESTLSAKKDLIFLGLLMSLVLSMLVRFLSLIAEGQKMYLFDFCNFSNVILVLYASLAPSCDWLFATCFYFTFGSLIYTVMAFRHSTSSDTSLTGRLIHAISISVHPLSTALVLYLRWVAIPNEQSNVDGNVPRQFAALIDGSIFWSDDVFYTPLTIYLMWLIVFYLVEFIFTNDVRLFKTDAAFSAWVKRWEYKDPQYIAVTHKIDAFSAWMNSFGIRDKRFVAVYGPVTFLAYSFACWLVFHIVASKYLWDSPRLNIAAIIGLFIWWINAGPTIGRFIYLVCAYILTSLMQIVMVIFLYGSIVKGWMFLTVYKIYEAIAFVMFYYIHWIIVPFHEYINVPVYTYIIVPLGRLLRWLFRLARTAVEKIMDFITQVAQKIAHILKVILSALSSFLSKVCRASYHMASNLLNWIVNAGKTTGTFAWKWIKPVLDFIVDVGTKILKFLYHAMVKIGEIVSWVMNKIIQFLKYILEKILDACIAIFWKLYNAVSYIFEKLSSAVSYVFEKLSRAVSYVFKNCISPAANALFNTGRYVIENWIAPVLEIVARLIGKTLSAMITAL